MDSLLKTGVLFYEKYNKLLNITGYLLLAFGLYLNYQNLIVVNLFNNDLFLVLMLMIAVLSAIVPVAGCVSLTILYAIYFIPINYILALVYLGLAFVFMIGISYEKNNLVYISLVYMILACNNLIILGVAIALYYILFIQRDMGMPFAISFLITCSSLFTNIFLDHALFVLPLYETAPENIFEYLTSFFSSDTVLPTIIEIIKPQIITLLIILFVSYVFFKIVKVKNKNKTIDIYVEYKLSIFSFLFSFGLLSIIPSIISVNNGLPIPTHQILLIGVGTFIGFIISLFIVRFPDASTTPVIQTSQSSISATEAMKKMREEEAKKKVLNEISSSKRLAPYEGNEDYIFISYSHRDTEVILPILEFLESKGFRFWYDEGIALGSEWPESIAQHLTNAKVCLAFMSPDSLDSSNCRREINFALSKNKEFLSVILKPVEMTPGIEMQISSYQSLLKYKYATEEEFLNVLLTADAIQCCRKLII